MANQYSDRDTVQAAFIGFDAAKNYAQAMRALTYTTMITVENGFWVVTAKACGQVDRIEKP
jgi:hypothetical protein